jgi:hypothetical protein
MLAMCLCSARGPLGPVGTYKVNDGKITDAMKVEDQDVFVRYEVYRFGLNPSTSPPG